MTLKAKTKPTPRKPKVAPVSAPARGVVSQQVGQRAQPASEKGKVPTARSKAIIGTGSGTARWSGQEQHVGNQPKRGTTAADAGLKTAVPTIRMSSVTQSDPSPLDYDLAALESAMSEAGGYLRDLEFRLAPVSICIPPKDPMVDSCNECAVAPVQERVQAIHRALEALVVRVRDATDALVI